MPVQTSYILSKHAVLAFSECLYLEMQLKQTPIHVSVIMPGPVATRIFTDSATTADASSHHHRQVMQEMLASQGISATEAARLILPRIAAGEFWISTHPQMTREMARQRADHLAGLAVPELAPDLLASLLPESSAG
jgi:short-subunit dehydrogenase